VKSSSPPSPTKDLLRRWSSLVVPVEDEHCAAVRRERLIGSIADTINRSARRRRGLSWRRRAVTALALAAAMAAGFGIWRGVVVSESSPEAVASLSADGPAHVVKATGTVMARTSRGTRSVANGRRAELTAGDELSTGPNGAAEMELSAAARVALSGATQVEVVDTQRLSQRLSLRRGRIDLAVPKEIEQNLVIATPVAEVHVVGTVFSVTVADRKCSEQVDTSVLVSRGEVLIVRTDGTSVALGAGRTWTSAPSEAEISSACASAQQEASVEEPRRKGRASAPAPLRGGTVANSELAAQNRLYRAALDARNDGQDARALALLDGFLSRYPDCPLSQEARVQRFRTLQRMGRHDEAASDARRYLADHESGFAREEARRIILSPVQKTPGPTR
jgi:ferric-dicitrate binding protein FerR (iron transport regulator)